MRHYCQTKKDLLKEIKHWVEHLEENKIEINIKPDPCLEETFILDIYEKLDCVNATDSVTEGEDGSR